MKLFKVTLLGSLLIASTWGFAATLPEKPHISVSGSSQVKVQPDTVRIEFQAFAVENNADSAKQVVDEQVNQVLSQLQSNGFHQSELTRADIQIRSEYEYIDKKRTQVGIKATRNLTYQLNDVSKLNAFLEILVTSNISNIGQINYALQNPEQWQSKARDLAVKDSIKKAQELAKSYNATLGKVYSVNYQDNNRAQPVMMRAMESDQAAPSYQNNFIVINERVESVFLLKP